MKVKLIKSVGINEKRAKALQQKAVELMIKQKIIIKESEIIAFMIDELLDNVKIDNNGLYYEENEEN